MLPRCSAWFKTAVFKGQFGSAVGDAAFVFLDAIQAKRATPSLAAKRGLILSKTLAITTEHSVDIAIVFQPWPLRLPCFLKNLFSSTRSFRRSSPRWPRPILISFFGCLISLFFRRRKELQKTHPNVMGIVAFPARTDSEWIKGELLVPRHT